jgi:hypothetical protein
VSLSIPGKNTKIFSSVPAIPANHPMGKTLIPNTLIDLGFRGLRFFDPSLFIEQKTEQQGACEILILQDDLTKRQ